MDEKNVIIIFIVLCQGQGLVSGTSGSYLLAITGVLSGETQRHRHKDETFPKTSREKEREEDLDALLVLPTSYSCGVGIQKNSKQPRLD